MTARRFPMAPSAFAVAFTLLAEPVLLGQSGQSGRDAPVMPKKDFSGSKAHAVASVTDCGTIAIKQASATVEVHLVGVDVPDGDDAAAAKAFLEQLLTGESVYVESAGDAKAEKPAKTPSGGKPEARVSGPAAEEDGVLADGTFVYVYRVPDGMCANLELIRQGYVAVSARPKFDQLELYRAFEKRARDAGKGLWASGGSARRAARTEKPAEQPREAVKSDKKADDDRGKGEASVAGTVYVTKSGKKYHRKDCQHVGEGATALSVADALKQNYGPCSRCKPPGKP